MENTLEQSAGTDRNETLNLAARRTTSAPFVRKTYLVDTDVQMAIARQFLLLAVCAGALGFGNVVVIQELLEVDPGTGVEMVMVYGYMLLLLGISAGLVSLMSVFLSHRIAGPAWNLNRAFHRAANGELWLKVNLRQTDLLRDLAASFNSTLAAWRKTIVGIDFEMRQLRKAADGNPDLMRSVQKIEKILAAYEVESPGERRSPR